MKNMNYPANYERITLEDTSSGSRFATMPNLCIDDLLKRALNYAPSADTLSRLKTTLAAAQK